MKAEFKNKAKEKLTEHQYDVVANAATEPPFTGEYLHNKEDGTYKCVVCNNILFKAEDKFDSQSGWPSFYDLAEKGSVELKDDNSLGMKRTEVLCSKCGAHLGHLFNDGPQDKTGLRYCINSAALDFEKKEES